MSELNKMNRASFIEALGALFEQTPAIADLTWEYRPFGSRDLLFQCMATLVKTLSPSQHMDLICAHPDLGSRTPMTEASVAEQNSLKIDQLSPEEEDRLQQLNQAYRAKFNFPFILAVRNHTPDSLFITFEQCLQNDPNVERQRAIDEILEIARLRLMDWVEE